MQAGKKRVAPVEDQLEAFGERVRALRIHRGFSQEQLAHAAERHWTFVSAIERGGRNPTLLTILDLARALRVHVTDLLAEDLPPGVAKPKTSKVRPGGGPRRVRRRRDSAP
jgi:transcriptional regulator with XRE-family HTH domain